MTPTEKKNLLKNWEEYYLHIGIPKDMRKTYLRYVENILNHNATIIFDLEHLSRLVGVDIIYLRKVIFSPKSFYRTFEIPKRSGGNRVITTPYQTLKHIQRWIYNNVLSGQKVHTYVHGFRPKRSIVTNVGQHTSGRYLWKIDLNDFFPSIKKEMVVQVFRQIGYTKEMSFFLASLCCLDDCLPQGAPTSPVLSNIVAKHMDNRLAKIAKNYHCRYTRYADDMAFSGNSLPLSFQVLVCNVIQECGFTINMQKTRVYGARACKILTGIRIQDGSLRLPKEKRRELSQIMYYIRRYGYDSHVGKLKIREINYLPSLIGRMIFWKQIEPENAFVKSSLEMLYSIYNQVYEGMPIDK